MDGNEDVTPMIDQELEFKKLLFQIAKQLNSKNVKDLIHFFDEIPKGDRPKIKNGLQLMEVLLRLDQVSYKNTEKLKKNLPRIGRKNLVAKLVDLEEELDSRIKSSMHQDEKPKTEDASRLIENDGSSDAKRNDTKDGNEKDVKDGSDAVMTNFHNEQLKNYNVKNIEDDNNDNRDDADEPMDEEEKNSDSDSDDEVYPMNGNPCGKCLIINNNFEDHEKAEPRLLSNIDERKISDVFKYLNFEIEVLKNLSKDKLFEHLTKEMLDIKKETHNAFTLYILTYGEGDISYSYDGGTCSIQEIIEMFADKNCKYLKEKPKFFFIQASQFTCSAEKSKEIQSKGIFPAADQVVWFGSSPDLYKSKGDGTWFISKCCKLLKKGAEKEKSLGDINRNLSNIIGDEMKSSNGKCIFKTFGDNKLRGTIQFCPIKSK